MTPIRFAVRAAPPPAGRQLRPRLRPARARTCTARCSTRSPTASSCPSCCTSPGRCSSGSSSTSPAYLDRLGRSARRRQAGAAARRASTSRCSPSLPREDRRRADPWMREAIRAPLRRRGHAASGSPSGSGSPSSRPTWPTPASRYALVDDRHFLVTGFSREQLHAPFWTESDGKRVALFPIDERLRYLIPFRPPEETADYLRELRGAGPRASRCWPTTARSSAAGRAPRSGSTGRAGSTASCATIGAAGRRGRGACSARSTRRSARCRAAGSPTCRPRSYREMEGWSLPPDAALRLAPARARPRRGRVAGPGRRADPRRALAQLPRQVPRVEPDAQEDAGALARCAASGATRPRRGARSAGRSATTRTGTASSAGSTCRTCGTPSGATWPRAEAALRRGEALAWERLDLDGDGHEEIWIHSAAFSALVSPARGGAIEEYTVFARGINYANVLTRRREAYHDLALERGRRVGRPLGDGGTASIHDIEDGIRLDERPPLDSDDRALFVDRESCPGASGSSEYAGGATTGRCISWARPRCAMHRRAAKGRARDRVPVPARPGTRLEKRIRFEPDGRADGDLPLGSVGRRARRPLRTEFSLAGAAGARVHTAADEWRYADRDGRQVRARARSHPAGRVGHAPWPRRRSARRERSELAAPGGSASCP